jgi:hypothetical protein
MTFKTGTILYTSDGRRVEFHHDHGGLAYVYPILTVIHQSSNYAGDDYHEEEDEQLAEHLIAIKMEDLYETRPITRIDDDIAERLAVLAFANAEISKAQRQAQSEVWKNSQIMDNAKRDLENWSKKHKPMQDLVRFLEGEPMFPLTVPSHSYHRGPARPSIPKMDDVRYIMLKKGSGDSWQVTKSRDSYTDFEVYYTEEERQGRITELFELALAAFRKKPDYGTRGIMHTTHLDYGSIKGWINAFPHLSIPEDITEGKIAADAAAVEAQKATLKAELDALTMEGK